MNVTTRGRYALRAVLRLATLEQDTPVSVQRIAELEDISAAYLEQLFIRLAESDVVVSTRGPHGGYLLKRKASEISVLSVLEAVEEPVELTPCAIDGARCTFGRAETCAIRPMWSGANDHLRAYFSRLTLESVLSGRSLQLQEG